MTGNNNPEFFAGFAWAVPRAFADPLSTCRFELGDTLYENKTAYGMPWSQARKNVGRAVQVLGPARGVVGKSGGDDSSAFDDSWQQEVVFDLIDLGLGTSETVTTTQGSLYTLLWKGDLVDSPPVPRQASDLKKRLPEFAGFFQKELLPDPKMIRFLMPCDAAAGLYREKYLKVKKQLESEFSTTVCLEPANGMGLDLEFLPTTQVACFEISGATEEMVEKALQAVLYRPAAGRKTDAVRFRLNAHGLILAG